MSLLGPIEAAASPYLFWIKLAGAVMLVGAIAGGGWYARGLVDAPALALEQTHTAEANTRTAQCHATHEKGRADGAEKAITALTAAADAARAATADLQAKAVLHAKQDADFIKELSNAPTSKICGNSAAELAFRRSVRGQGPAATAR